MEILNKEMEELFDNLKYCKLDLNNNIQYLNSLKKLVLNELDFMFLKRIQDLNSLQENITIIEYHIQENDSDLRGEILFNKKLTTQDIKEKVRINVCGFNHKLKLFSKQIIDLIRDFETKVLDLYNLITDKTICNEEFKTLASGNIENLFENYNTKIINNNINNNTNLIIGSLNTYQGINQNLSKSIRGDMNKERKKNNVMLEKQISETFSIKKSQIPIDKNNRNSSQNVEKTNSDNILLRNKRSKEEELIYLMERNFGRKYDSEYLKNLERQYLNLMRIRNPNDNTTYNYEVFLNSNEKNLPIYQKIKLEATKKIDLKDLLIISKCFQKFVIAENKGNNENNCFVYYVGGNLKDSNSILFLYHIIKYFCFCTNISNLLQISIISFFTMEDLLMDFLNNQKKIMEFEYDGMNENQFMTKIKNDFQKINEERNFLQKQRKNLTNKLSDN